MIKDKLNGEQPNKDHEILAYINYFVSLGIPGRFQTIFWDEVDGRTGWWIDDLDDWSIGYSYTPVGEDEFRFWLSLTELNSEAANLIKQAR